jgi:1-deoxy-D-xylulose-5-phosphate synthase
VVAIYSTFLQRAYDQLIHDVAMQNLPVVFALDRAGLVGADGATHAGAYDIPFLRCIPNISVACPADENECRQLLSTAFAQDHPVAVRYPRGAGAGVAVQPGLEGLPFGKGEVRRKRASGIAILAFGTLLYPALEAAEKAGRHGGQHALGQAAGHRTAAAGGTQPRCAGDGGRGRIMGGAGSAVAEALHAAGMKARAAAGPARRFIEHGDPPS